MKLKEYVKQLDKLYPSDCEVPSVIVQQLACLAAINLAAKGRLPASCGRGADIDMDIVNAGILAGLEKIKVHDGTLGTLRAFLYKTIAGTIQNYAWARENRVEDNHNTDITKLMIYDSVPRTGMGEQSADNPEDKERPSDFRSKVGDDYLITDETPESILSAEEESESNPTQEAFREVKAFLGKEDTALLLKSAQIGYDAAKRIEWASSLGLTSASLNTRLARIRKRARDWALRSN